MYPRTAGRFLDQVVLVPPEELRAARPERPQPLPGAEGPAGMEAMSRGGGRFRSSTRCRTWEPAIELTSRYQPSDGPMLTPGS